MSKYTGLEIAIIGISGRFPDADNVNAFWNNLREGVESIHFLQEQEAIEAGEPEDRVKDPNYVLANSHLSEKDYFDADFFDYRPDEARLMDPQMRLFYEVIWEALEDAGISVENAERSIGLYLGATNNANWQVCANLLNSEGLVDPFSAAQLANINFLSSKISYSLNLTGPSLFSDTACSTSLVNVHQACRSLLLSDCKVAIAGGVRVANGSKKGYLYKEGMIFSKDGHCRAFDESASGTIMGEGAGVVVLKKLSDAIKDGDNIHAIIKGTAINNDGHDKVGYTAPSAKGQAEAIIKAHSWAKIEPESISYVEAHGTATTLGDPIEVEALNLAFGKSVEKYCALGSVKTNIGHLDAAAGIAGLIKVVMSLKHRQIPPSLHFKKPNSKINFDKSPFYVNAELKDWSNDNHPLRAGVSSFGIGGTNAHVVLEEAPAEVTTSAGRPYHILNISAKSPEALNRNVVRLKKYLELEESLDLSDVSFTLQQGRSPFEFRKAIVCTSREDALTQLSALPSITNVSPITDGREPTIAFMFPGQGAQYANMCASLYQHEEIFRSVADQCFQIVLEESGLNLKAELFADGESNINETQFTQPALFVVEYALARLMMSWGIQPDIMIGHSIGEYAAACLGSVFTLKDALKLVVKRGALMQKMARGSMLSISISQEDLELHLQENNDISLATVNSSSSCVVSGTHDAIQRFVNVMDNAGFSSKKIHTSHAFHSYMMDDMLSDFKEEVETINISAQKIPFISNLTGKLATDQEIVNPEYWVEHLRKTVKFSNGIEEILATEAKVVFVEVGPGRVLSSFVASNSSMDQKHKVVTTLGHHGSDSDDVFHLLSGVTKLWLNGVKPDWKAFYANQQRRFVSLPTYSFDKIKYPTDFDAFKMISDATSGVPMVLPALPDIVKEQESSTENPTDGVSNTEQNMLVIWKRFFGRGHIDIADDFFEIGGDSLKALTIIEQINRQFDIEISLSEFFRKPTIRQLSEVIDNSEEITYLSIEKAVKKERYSLSASQQRLHFLYEFDKNSTAYNMPHTIRLEGVLDKEKLERAFEKLIIRHESLRTSFAIIDGQVYQRVSESIDFAVEYSESHAKEVQATVDKFIRPFDLTKPSLIRVGLIKLSLQEHILMVDLHHIITDGLSQSILIKDFMAIYRGDELAEVTLQYKDYSEWQQSEDQQEILASQGQFWQEQFAGEFTALELPTDFPRPTIRSHAGRTTSFSIDVEETQSLKSISEKVGSTMFMTVLAIFNVLLSKLSNTEDIVIGTTVAGRNHSDLERVIGLFVNTLALRNYPVRNSTFEEFLSDVVQRTLACFDNQSYQYEELLNELNVPRDTHRNPLFDVLLEFRGFQPEALILPGLTLESYNSGHNISKFDLTLMVTESEEQLFCNVEYSTDLFAEETIQRFISYFKKIVNQISQNSTIKLGEMDVLPSSERNQLLKEFNKTKVDYPKNKTIINLFDAQVKNCPNNLGVVCEEQRLSYEELNIQINRTVGYLHTNGVAHGDIVAVIADRSIDLIVYAYAVLKVGGVFLPIEPDYPVSRIKFILEDSRANKAICQFQYESILPESVLCIPILPSAELILYEKFSVDMSQNDLAYIIYTSGSTGHPKGVKISHKALYNYILWAKSSYITSEECPMALFSSIAFDLTITSLFLPLTSGNALHVYGNGSPDKIIQSVVSDGNAKVIKLTPAHLKILLESKTKFDHIQCFIVGGDVFDEDLAAQISDAGRANIEIYNEYGPTEATVGCVLYRYPTKNYRKSSSLLIGKPGANSRIFILDEALNILPVGVLGEIYIGGAQLANGYVNNDKLTHEKFVENPFEKGSKIYRTGDIGRWLSDGNLQFSGRVDDQVKIHGFRIELGEVEGQLLNHELVTDAVVVLHSNETDKYLVAYYVSQESIDTEALRGHMQSSLPNYMLPNYFVHLEHLPLTTNGKIDRKSLPDPLVVADNDYLAPQNDVENALVEIWSEVLDVSNEKLSVNKSFFELGGHSLKAVSAVGQINERLNIELSIIDIFDHTSITLLAKHISSLDQMMHSSIKPAPHKDYYPLSPAQRRMYFLYEFDKRALAYNMPQVVELNGKLDLEKLENSFHQLVQRHESLRTSFVIVDGLPVQKINPEVQFIVEIFNPEISEIDKIIEDFIRPFDLGAPSLIRAGLIQLSVEKHILLVDMHHIITDGVSHGILIKDFMTLYQQIQLPSITLCYKDYSEWFQKSEQQARLNQQKEFWLNEFSEDISVLDLPTDFQRPMIRSHKGSHTNFTLTEIESDALRSLGERAEATMFMTVLAIFNVLLSKLSNIEDITIGTPVAGRNHADLKEMIGLFVNTLALRNYPKSEMSFDSFLTAIREKSLLCFDNQSFQYEELIDELKIGRDTSRNPLFDVMFVFQNLDEEELTIPSLQLSPYTYSHDISKFDLSLIATDSGGPLHFSIEYSTELFEETTIKRFIGYFKRIVGSVLENSQQKISEIEILSEEEISQVLNEFNNTVVDYPEDTTVIDLFEKQVHKTPDQVALILGTKEITYKSFLLKVDQVAGMLIEKGVGQGDIVGVLGERTFELVAGIFGILKSGAAYLPIDSKFPVARIEYIIEDSGIETILVSKYAAESTLTADLIDLDLLNDLPFNGKKINNRASPTDLAYIIYTSGSTGNPKGVMVEHRSLTNRLNWMGTKYPIGSGDVLLQKTPIVFDVSVWELFWWSLNGASLCLLKSGDEGDPAILSQVIAEAGVSTIHFVPSMLQAFMDYVAVQGNQTDLTTLKLLFSSGEALKPSHVHNYHQLFSGSNQTKLVNLYGPTEATVDVSYYDCFGQSSYDLIPIGKPIDNISLYVLDKDNNLLPVGVAGELCIGGVGLSRGYLGKENLSKEKFIKDPFGKHDRLYKTGDLVRWLNDGNIEYLGRIDNQVKIRGYRIELGEIENQLSRHERITEAIVLAIDGQEEKRLIAYYVSSSVIDEAELENFVSKQLPEYMVPVHFVWFNKLPVTSNGKVDLKALVEVELDTDSNYDPPSGEIEVSLVGIWSEVLGIPEDRIGVNKSFFALGGHSVKAISLVNKIAQVMDISLPVREVFVNQNIRSLGAVLKKSQKSTSSGIEKTPDKPYYPLSSAQQRLYFLFKLEPDSLSYNMTRVERLEETVDHELLECVFNKLIHRHEALRTSFDTIDGKVVQKVHTVVNLDITYYNSDESGVASILEEFVRPFDLSIAPLVRVGLIAISDDQHILMVDMHHIITDGVSQEILIDNFNAMYYEAEELPELPLQYKDYVAWQHQPDQIAVMEKQEFYWIKELKGNLPILSLPTDFNRVEGDHDEGAFESVYLNQEAYQALRTCCKRYNVTSGIVLYTVFGVVLSKLAGQEDVVIGLSSTGRSHADLEGIIGMFVNSLPVRSFPESAKLFEDYLREVESSMLQALDNQDCPLERLVNLLDVKREPGRNPIFDVMLNFIGHFQHAVDFKNQKKSSNAPKTKRFDLTLNVSEYSNTVLLSLQYDTHLFKKETARNLLKYLVNVINELGELQDKRLYEIGLENKQTTSEIAASLLDTPKPPIESVECFPASYHQERLWFIDKFEANYLYKGSPGYHNIPVILDFDGLLNIQFLEQSLNTVIQRHDILRTVIVDSEEHPLQKVIAAANIILKVVECKGNIETRTDEEVRTPFELDQFLVRGILLKTKEDGFRLIVSFHHLIVDRYSINALSSEILQYYSALVNGEVLEIQKPTIPYGSFSKWQRETLAQLDTHLLSFWKSNLNGSLQKLELPEDRSRAVIHTYTGASQKVNIDPKLTKKLFTFTKSEGFSVGVFLMAVFKALLYKYSGEREVVIGTNFDNRPDGHFDPLIGPISNLLVLRSFLVRDQSFKCYVSKLHESVRVAQVYGQIPFDKLVKEIAPEKDMSRTALFDVLFNYQETPVSLPKIEGLGVRMSDTNYGYGKYDFNLFLEPRDSHIEGNLVYNADYFDASSVQQFVNHFGELLNQVLQNPDKLLSSLSVLTVSEERNLLKALSNTKTEYPEDKTIIDLFHEQVKKAPDKVALVFEKVTMTYAELDQRSDQLAGLLSHKGITTDHVVGLLTDRSINTIVGMFSILKAGGAYLPIDKDYPAERIQYLLKDSGATVLLTTKDFEGTSHYHSDVIFIEDALNYNSDVSKSSIKQAPEDLCYIIYTSGTTGNPKGVMVEHRNVVRLLFNEKFQFDFGSEDVWTMFHSHAFDFSVWEMYGALLNGGKLIIIPKMVARDPRQYLELLQKEEVTILNQTPGSFYNLIQEHPLEPLENLRLRQVIFGGEALSPNKLETWSDWYPNTKLVNMFGITETTVHVTYKEIKDEDIRLNTSSIGKPIPTLSAYIFDEDLKLVPRGVKGELLIGGEGVARGYLNNTSLTEEKFVSNPYDSNERLYRSGDMGRLLANGELEYLGRLDHQVKVRGFRIELGEVEGQLSKYPKVQEVVVLVKEKDGDNYLVAYYTAVEELSTTDIRSFLSEKLPDYMLPSYYVYLARIPLTSNGKIDNKSLPNPDFNLAEDFVTPRTKEELMLCGVWSLVLGVKSIGVTDNFFSVGGDSIKSIQISSRVRTMGYTMSVKDIFTNQTIAALALRLRPIERIADQQTVIGKIPLTAIQKRFFDGNIQSKHHFNQSVMLNFSDGITESEVFQIFTALHHHHDGLRMVFTQDGQDIVQESIDLNHPISIVAEDLTQVKSPNKRLLTICNQVQSSVDLSNGPLMKLGLFKMTDGTRLLIVIHHLVIDGVSWRILFEDIETLYQQSKQNKTFQLPLKTDSFKRWSEQLGAYRLSKSYQKASAYWNTMMQKSMVEIARDHPNGSHKLNDVQTTGFQLDKGLTDKLLTQVHSAFNTQINDILLAALLMSIRNQYGAGALMIELEGHGREDLLQDVDVSRTVGWFTSIYPVILEWNGDDPAVLIKSTKESLRSVPNNGVDYLIQKYLDKGPNFTEKSIKQSSISFNYLGQFDSDTDNKVFSIASEPSGRTTSLDETKEYDWDISGMITGGQLGMQLSYSKKQYNKEVLASLMSSYEKNLEGLIDYCSNHKNELSPSDLTYKELSIEALDDLQNKFPIEDVYRLSPMQEGMLFHSLLDSEADHYFEQMSYTLKGIIDVISMESSYNGLVSRYAILRTIFLAENHDHPLQVVLKEKETGFNYYDLRKEIAGGDKESIMSSHRLRDRNKKFDLSKDALMRVGVYRLDDDEYEFIWSHHHILMDGWCMSIIINEFNNLYHSFKSGKVVELPETQPYANYIGWLSLQDKEGSLNYWKNYLEGYNTLATLSGSRYESSSDPSRQSTTISLTTAQTKSLLHLTRKYAVTLNTIIQTAWGMLLARYNNTRDVVFGAVVSGRPAEVEGVESMVGLFINAVPVRVNYSEGDCIEGLIQRVQKNAIESEKHHFNLLSDIQSTSNLGVGLLDHIMVFENYPISDEVQDERDEDYIVTNVEIFEQTNYDLAIVVVPGDELKIRFDYNTQNYNVALIDKVACHINKVIEQIIADGDAAIEKTDILSSDEKRELLVDFNNTGVEYSRSTTIVDLFESKAAEVRDNVALVHHERTLSYATLNNQANQLAQVLRKHGVDKNEVVGLMLGRSFEMIVSIVGTLKAGGAYLPIDADYPGSRIEYMLSNSEVGVLLVDEQTFGTVKNFPGTVIDVSTLDFSEKEVKNPMSVITSSDLGYVIYTSGSTGKPKGVMLKHSNLTNLVNFDHSGTNIDFSCVLQFTTLSFDPSFREIFSTLLHGGQLVLADQSDTKDVAKLFSIIKEHEVRTLFMPGSLLNQLFNDEALADEAPLCIRHIVSAGEQTIIGETFKKYLSENEIYIHNHYGPSETHVITGHTVDPFKTIPSQPCIGKPIFNTQIYILDSESNLQPVGVPGELYAGGEQVGLGYLNNESLTEEKFVANPFIDGDRLYRTGDLARWLPGGEIEFLGRMDDQVKIRGFRVELGEVESQFSKYDGVKETVVIAKMIEGEKCLIGYYVSDTEIEPSDLRTYLSEQLPDFMVPSYFIYLKSLPLTPNGKVNRKALPDPEFVAGQDHVNPANEVEERLQHIWSEVLKVNKEVISTTKSFFELGGHSLKAMTLVNKVSKEFNVNVPLKEIFLKPSIEGQSDIIMAMHQMRNTNTDELNLIEVSI